MNKKQFLLIPFLFLVTISYLHAQDTIVDKIVAVIGKNIIKLSDVERDYMQYRMQGNIQGGSMDTKCKLIENLLYQKLLLAQAEIDSVDVTQEQVDAKIDERVKYYTAQFGSKEKLEKFLKKTVESFKDEIRPVFREQLIVQKMQGSIAGDIKVTPSEVNNFFAKLNKDSIPEIGSEYEIGQIVKKPPVSEAERKAVKEKLNGLRDRILKGESFTALAALYSEDPGSAKKGGELGLTSRGDMVPEFEAVAFNLAKDEVSPVIETKYGFHIIQLIERKGSFVNVRHILIRPKVSIEDLIKAKNLLDSVYSLVGLKKITFEQAAEKFSDDDSRTNGGAMINPYNQSTKFPADEVDESVFFTIDKMEPGHISQPVAMKTEDDQQAYRLLYLKKRSAPHTANMKDDYDKIQSMALEQKRNETINTWILGKLDKTYVNIMDEFKECHYLHNWIKK